MHRPRLALGTLAPGSTLPFLLLPDGETGGQEGGGGANPPAPQQNADGYPANTPVEQMTAEQQAAYWRFHSRKHEERSRENAEWRKANEEKVKEHDRLVEASRSEQEKALEAAKAAAIADGQRAGRSELIPRLVEAEFAAAAPSLKREDVAKLLAPLDKTYFLGEDGNVDTGKVTAYVTENAALFGSVGERRLPPGFPDLGQGGRGGTTPSGKEAGLAEAERRFGKPAGTASA